MWLSFAVNEAGCPITNINRNVNRGFDTKPTLILASELISIPKPFNHPRESDLKIDKNHSISKR